MCRRLIINAGIVRVIARKAKDCYTVTEVEDWIKNPEFGLIKAGV